MGGKWLAAGAGFLLLMVLALLGWLRSPRTPVDALVPEARASEERAERELSSTAVQEEGHRANFAQASAEASSELPAEDSLGPTQREGDEQSWIVVRFVDESGEAIERVEIFSSLDERLLLLRDLGERYAYLPNPEAVEDPESSPLATSDKDGWARIPCRRDLGPRRGNRQLFFHALREGFRLEPFDASVQSAGTTWLEDVVLVPGRILSGDLWMADGALAPAGWILVTEEEDHGNALRTVSASSDGSFQIVGLPTEGLGVWAWHDESFSEVQRIPPGTDDVTGVVLALNPRDESRLITGRVLSPEGVPVARVRIFAYTWDVDHDPGEAGFHPVAITDEKGRFRFRQEREARVLDVVDMEPNRWRPLRVRDVDPGTHDLELRFEDVTYFLVRVLDRDQDPIAGASVDATSTTSTGRTHLGGVRTDGPVRARLRLPLEPFTIGVRAQAFHDALLGPFMPNEAIEEVLAVLEEMPILSGRVTHRGEPVPNASVRLGRAFEPGKYGRSNEITHAEQWFDFDLWGGGRRSAAVKTDREGGYALPLAGRSRWMVPVVEASTFPRTRGPSLSWNGTDALSGADVELVASGSIEGKVRMPPGSSPRAHTVGASNGDGLVRIVTAGPEGDFRFDGLQPGGWQLRQVFLESPAAEFQLRPMHQVSEQPLWDCWVRSGETARCDLDLRFLRSCRLQGLILLDGEGRRGLARLYPPGELPLQPDNPYVAESDIEDGLFSLEVTEGGRYLLAATVGNPGFAIVQAVDVSPGLSEWSLDVRTGGLRLPARPDSYFERSAVYTTEISSGVTAISTLAFMRTTSVPAGTGQIGWVTDTRRWRWFDILHLEVHSGTSIEVRAGETFELPPGVLSW